jgi:DNA-binding response OmpR family regulator
MHSLLKGRLILVAEDQPLVALDIKDAVSNAGALPVIAGTLQEGLRLAEDPRLSAAILDLALGEDDSSPLCARLSERGIPFIIYTGYADVPPACRAGVILRKPAPPDFLLAALAQLLTP